jgi:hypothetical protein
LFNILRFVFSLSAIPVNGYTTRITPPTSHGLVQVPRLFSRILVVTTAALTVLLVVSTAAQGVAPPLRLYIASTAGVTGRQ